MKNTIFPSHYTGYLVNNPVINPVIGHTVIIPVQRAIEIRDPLSIVISYDIIHHSSFVSSSNEIRDPLSINGSLSTIIHQ
jgi:hypothetical protein